MFRISGKSPTVKPNKGRVYADARESNMGARHGAEERNARGEKERLNRCGRNFEMRHDRLWVSGVAPDGKHEKNSPTIHLTVSELQGDFATVMGNIGSGCWRRRFLAALVQSGTLALQARRPVEHDGNRHVIFSNGFAV